MTQNPPEITEQDIEDLYNTICQTRDNLLEAKEKCFRLFCIARRRQCFVQGKTRIDTLLKKKSGAKKKPAAKTSAPKQD